MLGTGSVKYKLYVGLSSVFIRAMTFYHNSVYIIFVHFHVSLQVLSPTNQCSPVETTDQASPPDITGSHRPQEAVIGTLAEQTVSSPTLYVNGCWDAQWWS